MKQLVEDNMEEIGEHFYIVKDYVNYSGMLEVSF